MAHFDVFNGDADGILALLQLRKHAPIASEKITGVKRDISLLKQVNAAPGDSVTVLDISMEKNTDALQRLLEKKVDIFYADHHRSGDVPVSTHLEAHIDLSADTCTSLIIDKCLLGKYRTWAITAAYGDNLIGVADRLASKSRLSLGEMAYLRELGTLINYNGYGEIVDDLLFEPSALFDLLMGYESPFDLMEEKGSPYFLLKSAFEKDMLKAKSTQPFYSDDVLDAFILPNEPASRRISGVWGNELANRSPQKSHLVLTTNSDDSYTVSLRAPLHNKQGADEICSAFATGGGRAGAAGINKLKTEKIETLIQKTVSFYKR
ncbi:DHH family phosphoesterase [Enterovibrio norvegicus]|uniref:DHH family phosphoesterase n=1 Tax=Enterovibrio norvegicus TaxID=188144 RepID=UPI00352F6CCE